MASLATYKAIPRKHPVPTVIGQMTGLGFVQASSVGLLIVWPGVVTSSTLRRIPWWSLRQWSEVSGILPLSLLLALVLRQLVVALMLWVR